MKTLAVLLAALVGSALPAAAQDWVPTEPVEVVVHNSPGGGNDILARALVSIIEQEELAPVRMQVANRSGGGATTAAAYMKEQAGNPHVIAIYSNLWTSSTLVQQEAETAPADLTPIATLLFDPAVVVVTGNSPYQSLEELLKIGTEEPGRIKMGGGSVSGREYIMLQQIKAASGIDWKYISFPSGGERIAALLGNHVDVMILEPAEAAQLVRGGQIKVLAKAGLEEIAEFPDAKPLSDFGIDIELVAAARGVAGTPDIPQEAAAYYADLFQKTLETDAWRAYAEKSMVTTAFLGPDESRAFLEKLTEDMRSALESAGLETVR